MNRSEAKSKLFLDLIALAIVSWILWLRTGEDRIVPAIFTLALVIATAFHAFAFVRLARPQIVPPPRVQMSLGEATAILERATEEAKQRVPATRPPFKTIADEDPQWRRASAAILVGFCVTAVVFQACVPLTPMGKDSRLSHEGLMVAAMFLGAAAVNSGPYVWRRIKNRKSKFQNRNSKMKRGRPSGRPWKRLGDLRKVVIGTERLPHGLDVAVQLLKLGLLGVHHVVRRRLERDLACEELIPEPQV